jgi:hypothetical protein
MWKAFICIGFVLLMFGTMLQAETSKSTQAFERGVIVADVMGTKTITVKFTIWTRFEHWRLLGENCHLFTNIAVMKTD